MQRKDFVNDRVEKLTILIAIFSYGSQRVRKLIGKGYRAHMMLETLNSLQREPQQADLNTRRQRLLAIHHAQFLFAAWVHAGSLVGNQPL